MRSVFLYGLLGVLLCSALLGKTQSLSDNATDTTASIYAVPLSDTLLKFRRSFPGYTGNFPQQSTQFLVASIVVKGNKKTRNDIVLREIPFNPGEQYSLQDLLALFEIAEQQLMNTALFHSVKLFASGFEGNCLEITTEVVERWYLFPIPYFKLIDRNFNQWLVDQRANLNRVNYGIKLMYNNVTGHNDKLRLWLINGYTRQFTISYEKPFIDRAMRWGFQLATSTGQAKELNYNTINDKQVFLRTEEKFIRNFFTASAALTYRKKLYSRHSIGIAFLKERVADTVLMANPSYNGSSNQRVSFPEFFYQFQYVKMDYLPYPTKGYATRVRFSKSGLNPAFNLWQLHWHGYGSWVTGPKSFLGVQAYAGIKLPFRQPYFNKRFLGYDDVFLKGYEYYVIDGVAGGFVRATYTRELFRLNIGLPNYLRKKRGLDAIPIRVFGKVFGNSGYVYDPEPGLNHLNNKLLTAGGIGIDVLTLYDITIRLEYSFNQLGQNGLFLHRNSSF